MTLLISDIDDFAATPADLSDVEFEGSPEAVELTVDGETRKCHRTQAVTFDRPSSSQTTESFFDLAGELIPPCDATVRWDGGIAFLHVVAYHYCTLDSILHFGDEQRKSPEVLGRTEADAFRARAVAENVIDDICRRTFRATYKEDRWYGDDVFQLSWPASEILSDYFELVNDGLIRVMRHCVYTGAQPSVGSEIRYIAGLDYGVPAALSHAAAKLAASYLMASRVPDRAVYESTEAGMTRYTLASESSTGIPDVDAVLMRYARTREVLL